MSRARCPNCGCDLRVVIVGGDEAPVMRRHVVQRRRQMTNGFLKRVAEEYRQHLDEGRNPGASIQHEYNVSPRTVRYWLAKARERGILTVPPPGHRRPA